MGGLTHQASAAGFSVDVSPDKDGSLRMVVRGDLDVSTSEMLVRHVEDLNDVGPTLIVDMSGVAFMDSTGLRALWSLRQRITTLGGKLMLSSPSTPVQRLLRTTKLDKVFEYVPTADAS